MNKNKIENIFLDVAKRNEDAESMVEELRGLLSSGNITEADYDYLSDNWDSILEKNGLLEA